MPKESKKGKNNRNCSLHKSKAFLYNVNNGETAMEIIKIRFKTFKIILNEEESEKYSFISDKELTDIEISRSVDEFIDDISKQESIDIKNENLLIQVYPTKNNGCEVYICGTEENNMYKDRMAPAGQKKGVSYINVYRFDDIGMLLDACSRLNAVNLDVESDVYYDTEKCKYYLLCQGISAKEMRFAFLNEYSKQLKSPYAYFVREHLKCLCKENAIERFASLNTNFSLELQS